MEFSQVYFDMYEREKEQYEREMKIYHEQEQSRTLAAEGGKGGESSEEVDTAAMGMEAQSAVDALMMDNWHIDNDMPPIVCRHMTIS